MQDPARHSKDQISTAIGAILPNLELTLLRSRMRLEYRELVSFRDVFFVWHNVEKYAVIQTMHATY